MARASGKMDWMPVFAFALRPDGTRVNIKTGAPFWDGHESRFGFFRRFFQAL